jgi:hypothetical protein
MYISLSKKIIFASPFFCFVSVFSSFMGSEDPLNALEVFSSPPTAQLKAEPKKGFQYLLNTALRVLPWRSQETGKKEVVLEELQQPDDIILAQGAELQQLGDIILAQGAELQQPGDISLIFNKFEKAMKKDDPRKVKKYAAELGARGIRLNNYALAIAAASSYSFKCVTFFTAQVEDLNRRNENGETLLHVIGKTVPPALEYAIQGVPANQVVPVLTAQDRWNQTIIHLAYNALYFWAGDRARNMLQEQGIDASSITDQQGMTVATCRKLNKFLQYFSFAALSLFFGLMLWATISDSGAAE